MMRKLQEESFMNAQHMVEESTHQVVKEVVFDDKYEPLKEVQESLEVEEAYEAIDLYSSIKLTYVLVIDSCAPFQYSSSSYILYELEPRKQFFYQHRHSKPSLAKLMCIIFSYQVKPKDFHNKSHMW